MKTKLTLSIDEEVANKTKAYAEKYETSVAAVVEDLLVELLRDVDSSEGDQPPGSGTEQMINAIPPHKKVIDYDYHELKSRALEEKFGGTGDEEEN